MEDHLCIGLNGIEVLPTVTYAHNTSRMRQDGIAVFDGYEAGTSTKDMTHKRRTRRCASTAVHFTSDVRLQIKKEEFLASRENKQRFINTGQRA